VNTVTATIMGQTTEMPQRKNPKRHIYST